MLNSLMLKAKNYSPERIADDFNGHSGVLRRWPEENSNGNDAIFEAALKRPYEQANGVVTGSCA